MAVSKKAMIEARKARVPLSRVAIQLRRSDKRIRARVAGIGSGLMLLLICAGSFVMYYRPLEAVTRSVDISAAQQLADARADGLSNVFDLTAESAGKSGEIKPSPQIAELASNSVDQELQVAIVKFETPVSPSRESEDAIQSFASAANAGAQANDAAPSSGESGAEPKLENAAVAGQNPRAPVFAPPEDSSAQQPNVPVAAPKSSQPSFAEAPSSVQAVEPRIQLAAAVAPKDIAAILQPREDTTCTTDLQALAEKATVYFPLSSVAVQITDNANLKLLVGAVRNCPSIRIDVGGHTDKTGEQLLNLQLSWQRAENTIKYLQSIGADISRFSPVGFSATRPLYNEQTGLAQAKNRRVEFILR
ncbi:MAG: OmpA family protein [Chitinophagales bacterium]|nr:OmpA family protein [Hyphomicrobiales bacterium]